MDRKVKLWKMPPRPSRTAEQDGSPAAAPGLPMGLGALQRSAGNRAVQQLFPAAATSRRAEPTVQRGGQGGPKPDGATVESPLIPPAWVRQPGTGDIIVARFGDRMVALPAQGNFVLIRPTTAEIQPSPPSPLVTVPTVNKESIKMVNVGGQTGFLIDAGGNPNINFPTLNNSTTTSGVLFPGAFAVMSAALGVQSTTGVIITHLHDDHVQSLFQIVLNNGIRPENIHFPEGFAINASAPSSTFARLLTLLQNDPVAQGFGHRPNAAYGVIRTPGQGNWWRTEIRSGEVKFEMYGITAAFRELEARRAAGQPQESARVGGQRVPSLADTASLVTRITHEPSGLRVIFVSDSRFTDMAMLKAAMGAGYAEMLEGVTVIEGLGHHLGALESSADLTGLAEFLKDAQLRSGNLIVIAQSQETRGGRQFLNRSFIAALNAAGIRVKVALEPLNGAVGSFTINSDRTVSYAGGGRAESFEGSAPVRVEIARLSRLRSVEETLTSFAPYAEPQYQRGPEFRAARQSLERALESLMDTTADNVRRGAAGRSSPTLRDPAAQARALAAAQGTRADVESLLSSEFMEGLAELRRTGPLYTILEREVAESRTTGRMSDKGINALWELAPEVARKLLGESGLSRRAQAAAARYLPGQPAPLRIRSVAAVLAIVEVVNIAAPIVEQVRADRFSKNVQPSLEDIMWWQHKGVFPAMEAVDDNLWPWSNEWTEKPERIQSLLNDKEVSYLTLTGIPEPNWDPLTVWASGNLRNFRDWAANIDDTKAIRVSGGTGPGDQTFEYRTSRVHGRTVGFEVDEIWYHNDRLDRILNAAAREVIRNSKEQIGGPGGPDRSTGSESMTQMTGRAPAIYSDKPKALGRMTFAPGSNMTLYTLYGQRPISGWPPTSIFYAFPPHGDWDVPDDYLLVGGADFDTYTKVFSARNMIKLENVDGYGGHLNHYVKPNVYEILLARKSELVNAK